MITCSLCPNNATINLKADGEAYPTPYCASHGDAKRIELTERQIAYSVAPIKNEEELSALLATVTSQRDALQVEVTSLRTLGNNENLLREKDARIEELSLQCSEHDNLKAEAQELRQEVVTLRGVKQELELLKLAHEALKLENKKLAEATAT